MAQRLYVGNLLYQVQPEEISDLFASRDIAIKNVDMSIDPFSGRNPSYCFVDLEASEDAFDAVETLQGPTIRDRTIRVNYDTGKRASRTQHVETQMQNGEWWTYQFKPDDSVFAFDRYSPADAREHWTKPVDEGRRFWVGGLSDICNQMFVNGEMRELFEGYNLQAVSKRVLPARRDMSVPATGQCYCFVDLPSAVEAQEAVVKLHGRPTPYGGAYRIVIAKDQTDRKVCREQFGVQRVGEIKRNLAGNWRVRT